MPSSTSRRSDAAHPAGPARLPFKVIAFRRDANGRLVPGPLMEVSSGDIAWRCARAAASAPGNVGAVELRDGTLLAQFGQVDLDALPH